MGVLRVEMLKYCTVYVCVVALVSVVLVYEQLLSSQSVFLYSLLFGAMPVMWMQIGKAVLPRVRNGKCD